MAFDKAVRDLLSHFSNILGSEISKTDPVKRRLDAYRKMYNESTPEDHHEDFLTFFSRHRVELLSGYENDIWLKTQTSYIQFGESDEFKKYRLTVSVFYSKACSARDAITEILDKLPPSMYEQHAKEAKQLIWPEIVFLHLYRALLEVLPEGDDKVQIKVFYKRLAEELKFTEGGVLDTASNGSAEALGSMTEMMKKMGVKLPEGAQLPSMDQIQQMMSGMLQNSGLGDVMNNIMKDFTSSSDPAEGIKKAFGHLTSPDTIAKVQSAVGEGGLQSLLQPPDEGGSAGPDDSLPPPPPE